MWLSHQCCYVATSSCIISDGDAGSVDGLPPRPLSVRWACHRRRVLFWSPSHSSAIMRSISHVVRSVTAKVGSCSTPLLVATSRGGVSHASLPHPHAPVFRMWVGVGMRHVGVSCVAIVGHRGDVFVGTTMIRGVRSPGRSPGNISTPTSTLHGHHTLMRVGVVGVSLGVASLCS